MRSNRSEKVFVLEICVLSLAVLLIGILFWLFGRFVLPENEECDAVASNENVITVILDAGHGGGDPGASVGDVCEKDLNLVLVNRIKGYLSLYNCKVILTREGDSLLADKNSKNKKREDLLNRVAIAKEYPDSLFVSIHMNKFPETRYSGLQTFYSPNNRYSEAMALMVQGNNKRYLESNNSRSVKRADSSIYVLDRITSPAILIECGFLSNDEDRTKLLDDEYRNKLAFVIANSIIEYYGL